MYPYVLAFLAAVSVFLERPREAQRSPEMPKEAQRDPERPRKAQRGREWIEHVVVIRIREFGVARKNRGLY